jgi:hypothetical protein
MSTDYESWAWKILGRHTNETLTPLSERFDVEAAIARSLEEREALYRRLNNIKPSLATYWSLPEVEKQMLHKKR